MSHDNPPPIPRDARLDDMSHEAVVIPPHSSSEAEKTMSAKEISRAAEIAALLSRLEADTGISADMLLKVGRDEMADSVAESHMNLVRAKKDQGNDIARMREIKNKAEEAAMDAKIDQMHAEKISKAREAAKRAAGE